MNQHEKPRLTDVVSARGLSVGTHLTTRRHGYVHHGMYIGNVRVIHYAGLSRCLDRGPIEGISIDHFSAGFGFNVVPPPHSQYTGAEIARRVASRLGEQDYRLLTNNCEHLCLWCIVGQGKSDQIDACIRNPARAVRVLLTLLFCTLVRDCLLASFVRANEVPVFALNG